MRTNYRRPTQATLLIAHCAGMIDLVALPVWVGTLISGLGLSEPQAGGLVSLFLLSAVGCSVLVAKQLAQLAARRLASMGYATAAIAFMMASWVHGYWLLALLHIVAGAGAALGLSLTHSAIGRSHNPHRLFAWAGLALGVFATAFLGSAPVLIEAFGPPTLFKLFGGVMAISALACAAGFPNAHSADASTTPQAPTRATPVPKAAYLCAGGVACLALTQAIVFSFMERVGVNHGLGPSQMSALLIALGLVNLLPAPLAAWLQKRWPIQQVLWLGPLVQATLAVLLCSAPWVEGYALAALGFSAVMIFTHTFAFGWLAQLDPSGRMVAATPAMLMTGSAIGPVLGGVLVASLGYRALGIAAIVVSLVAVWFFLKSTDNNKRTAATTAA